MTEEQAAAMIDLLTSLQSVGQSLVWLLTAIAAVVSMGYGAVSWRMILFAKNSKHLWGVVLVLAVVGQASGANVFRAIVVNNGPPLRLIAWVTSPGPGEQLYFLPAAAAGGNSGRVAAWFHWVDAQHNGFLFGGENLSLAQVIASQWWAGNHAIFDDMDAVGKRWWFDELDNQGRLFEAFRASLATNTPDGTTYDTAWANFYDSHGGRPVGLPNVIKLYGPHGQVPSDLTFDWSADVPAAFSAFGARLRPGAFLASQSSNEFRALIRTVPYQQSGPVFWTLNHENGRMDSFAYSQADNTLAQMTSDLHANYVANAGSAAPQSPARWYSFANDTGPPVGGAPVAWRVHESVARGGAVYILTWDAAVNRYHDPGNIRTLQWLGGAHAGDVGHWQWELP